MSNRRITAASFSLSDVATGDMIFIALGTLLMLGSALFAAGSNSNVRAAADAMGAARLLSASSLYVQQGATSFSAGGSSKLTLAAASASNVGAAFDDVARSAGSLFTLPSIKAPAADAFSAWVSLRASISSLAVPAASAGELSDALGRSAPALSVLMKRLETSGKAAGSMARAYEAASRLALNAETGIGAASVARVGSDLQLLANDLAGSEFRQELTFLEAVAPVTKGAMAVRIQKEQLLAAAEAARAARSAADSLAVASSRSSGGMLMGLLAGLCAVAGFVCLGLGIKGAASEFSRRFVRATQSFRAAEQARTELVSALRESLHGETPVEVALSQSSAEMAEIARMVNDLLAAARDKAKLISEAATDGLASNAEISALIDGFTGEVQVVLASLSDEIKVLDRGAAAASGMALDAKVLVSAAIQAVSQSSDATGVAQDAASRLESMREVLQDTSKRVKRLGERSQEISTVVDSLGFLSEQISVLALNAQLEAERAGEAGAGFQTVAREVKALAHRAEAALEQISGLIQGVQADARSAAETVERSTGQVVAGANIGAVSQSLLGVLTPLAETMGTMAKDVHARANSAAQASLESSASAAEIQRSVAALEERARKLKGSVGRNQASIKDVLASSADKSTYSN